jgi:hypothetical protein
VVTPASLACQVRTALPKSAMAQESVDVQFAYGEPDTGHWCETCLKPAGYEVDVYALFSTGVRPIGRWRGCWDCAEWKGESNDSA